MIVTFDLVVGSNETFGGALYIAVVIFSLLAASIVCLFFFLLLLVVSSAVAVAVTIEIWRCPEVRVVLTTLAR